MQVFALLGYGLLLLNFEWICQCVFIFANASDLPGDFQTGRAAGNRKSRVGNLGSNIDRRITTNASQLVAELATEGFKIIGELNHCRTAAVKSDIAVIDGFEIIGHNL